MGIEKTELQPLVKLDGITGCILDKMEGHAPPFMAECEKNVMGEIEGFAKEAVRHNDKSAVQAAEDHAGGLLDSVCAANRKYFEMGMKAGEGLILQLLWNE